MASINPKDISKELMEKAAACKTPEELLALAKAEGYEMTKEEAEAFLAEGGVVNLSDEEMAKVAGGDIDWACAAQCRGDCLDETIQVWR